MQPKCRTHYAADSTDGSSRPPRRKHVLYFEDNEDDCFLLRHALRAAKIDCHLEIISTAAAAQQFLRSEITEVPDLIICDLGLGGLSGLDLLEWIRGQPRLARVPLMAVTGSLPPAQRERANQLGVDACIEKSVDWRELTKIVARLLGV